MAENDKEKKDELRKRAEEIMKFRPDSIKSVSPEEIPRILEELQIQKIQLELQNEELLNTQRALENAHDRFAELYNKAPVGYVVLDEAGVIRKANKTICQMMDVSDLELQGKALVDFLHEDDKPVFRVRLKKFFQKPQSKQLEIRFGHGFKTLFHARIEAVPQKDSHVSQTGSNRELLVTISDISELKKAEMEIKESEKRFRSVFENMAAAFCLFEVVKDQSGKSHDLRYLEVNESFETLSGKVSHQIIGKTILDVFPNIDLERLRIYLNVAESGEQKTIKRYSELFDKYMEATCFSPQAGQCAIIYTDKTQSWHTEELLKYRVHLMEFAESHTLDELLEETLNQVERLTNSSIGFYHFVEPDQQTLSLQAWSTKTKEYFCKAEGAGLHYKIDEAGVWVDCVREDGPVIHNDYMELTHRRGMPEGHAEVVRELVVPIKRDGKIVSILGIGNKPVNYTRQDQDITTYVADVAWEIVEKKRAGAERESLHAQLIQSQKMEAIGSLAGGIAHDFNNMLGIIMGCSQLAQYDVKKNSPVAEELNTIVDTTMKARDLTFKLLSFARPEKLNLSDVSVKDTLIELKYLLGRTLPKKIDVDIDVELEMARIKVDKGQIMQSLINICNNSADAMPGGGKIVLSAKNESGTASYPSVPGALSKDSVCHIKIQDTGTGIGDEIKHKVFDAFFTTKGIGKGTGLGLSVTHSIIERHGGIIKIDSIPNKGTSVDIYLPFSDLPHTELTPATVTPAINAKQQLTILVVDDEIHLLNMTRKLLEKKKHKVHIADSGMKAVKIFKENHMSIDLVILDFIMPRMDAFDVYEELVVIDPGVKVLIASGYSEEGRVSDLLNKGALGFIQKPFQIDELSAAVNEIID